MKHLLPILLIGALAGCAAITSEDPGVTTLEATQLGLHDTNAAWPTEQWWQRYNDDQLNGLIVEAIAGSPSLSAAQARLKMANAAVSGARAIQLPQLNANYTMTRNRYSENYIYPPPFAGSMQTDNSLRLDLSFDMDLWGGNRARYAAAATRQQASLAELHLARNTLVSAVVQSYFSLQNALAQQEVIAKIVRQLEDVLNITRQRVSAGLDTDVEANQADSAVSAARVQLSQITTNAGLLRNQIAALVGAGPERGQTVRESRLTQAAPSAPQSLPLDLLGRRPDIVAAKLRVDAASNEISAAKAQFYPNVNLTAFAGFMSLGLSNLLQSASQVYGAGPAVTLPIFNGGALNAELDARRAERELAIADYNQTLLAALREVADAVTAIQALHEQMTDQAASLRAITSAYDIAVKRYKSGLGNFIQVLLAQNEVQKQAVLDTDLRVRAYKLDAQLATALGGGYETNETKP